MDLIKYFQVQWASWKKKWYGSGTFIIKGCEVKWETAYFDSFDEAAKAAKEKACEVINQFAPETNGENH